MEAADSDMAIWMEATAKAAEISKRRMKEAVEECEVKSASAKVTALLSLLVGVPIDRCEIF